MFVTSAIILTTTLTAQASERSEYKDLVNSYVTINAQAENRPPAERRPQRSGEMQPDFPDGENKLSVDFDALLGINGDTVGWIYIEGTPVNYPVVQAGNNSYYLKKSFSKESNKIGTIFLDNALDMDSSDVVILYGHNMGSGRSEMFSSLTKYDKQDYMDKHGEIVTATVNGHETTWNVFAVLHANITVAEEAALYRKQNFKSNELYSEYIQLIKSYQLYETGLTPASGQRLLMLSTCRGDGLRELRRLIFAVEVGG